MSEMTFNPFDLQARAERQAHLRDHPMQAHMMRVQAEEAAERKADEVRRAQLAEQREAEAFALAQAGRLPTLDTLFAEAMASRSEGDPMELQRQAEAAERRAAAMAYAATHQGSTLEQILARASMVSDAQANAADARARAERAAERAREADQAQRARWAREDAEAQRSGGSLLANPAAQIGAQAALRGALTGR